LWSSRGRLPLNSLPACSIMPGFYACTGCFPGQSAIKAVSQSDLQRLTYGTSYKAGVPGKVMTEDAKWENFIDVHDVGKRDTKYFKYQRKEAPLLDRSACSMRREFIELPLGDNVVNAALAQSFKGGLKGGAAGLDVSAKHDSAYKAEFVRYADDRAQAAKPKSCKPKQSRTKTITGMTEMLETKAFSHAVHTAPNAALAKAAETVLARPNLGLSGAQAGPPPGTSYKKEYCSPLKASASAPQLWKDDASEMQLPCVLLPADHPSFKMTRNCYMSPGQ